MIDSARMEQLYKFALGFNPKFEEQALAQSEFNKDKYFRKALHTFDDIQVVLVCLGDLQSSGLHDHDESECVFKVLEGYCVNQTYRRESQLITKSDRPNDLVRWQTDIMFKGCISKVGAGVIHDVTNMAASGTILLNFYSPPLKEKACC